MIKTKRVLNSNLHSKPVGMEMNSSWRIRCSSLTSSSDRSNSRWRTTTKKREREATKKISSSSSRTNNSRSSSSSITISTTTQVSRSSSMETRRVRKIKSVSRSIWIQIGFVSFKHDSYRTAGTTSILNFTFKISAMINRVKKMISSKSKKKRSPSAVVSITTNSGKTMRLTRLAATNRTLWICPTRLVTVTYR